jgi:hypothetical protein
MGFFGGLFRALQGKPIFRVYSGQNSLQPQVGPESVGQQAAPVVRLGRVECHSEGARTDVYADIHNESIQPIFLDEIRLMGGRRQLDNLLQPGQSHQFMVYSGSRANSLHQGYAELRYRTQTNEYFVAMNQIRFKHEPDGSFSVVEFLPAGQARSV